MYIDLMSQYTSLSVNIKLANILGLNIAVYWAELMNVYPRVIKKKEEELFNNDGYFDLDREYIKSRTTLSEEDQMLCDVALSKLDIVKVDPNNSCRIKIDIQKMYAYIVEDDPSVLKDIQKRAKVKRDDNSAVKREMIRRNLNAAISATDVDILSALRNWVDSLVEAKTFASKIVVETFQKNLISYTSDKQVQLKIIEIATIHAWADFAWAKNAFEKDYKGRSGTFIGKQQKQGTGIDTTSGF